MLGIIKQILIESPDEAFDINGHTLSFNDSTRSFFIYNGKFYIGDELNPGDDIRDENGELYGTYTHGGLARDLIDKGIMEKKWRHGSRELPCAGRVWLNDKFISFWTYPKNHTEIEWLIKALKKNGIHADDSWFVETPDRVIPASNYESETKVRTPTNTDKQRAPQISGTSRLVGNQLEMFAKGKGWKKVKMGQPWPSVAGETQRKYDPKNPAGFVPHVDKDEKPKAGKDDAWLQARMKEHAGVKPIARKPGANVQPKKDIPKSWTYAQYHGTVYQEDEE